MQQYNYKKGLGAVAVCYLIWGFQPLYFDLCSDVDTFFFDGLPHYLGFDRLHHTAEGAGQIAASDGSIS